MAKRPTKSAEQQEESLPVAAKPEAQAHLPQQQRVESAESAAGDDHVLMNFPAPLRLMLQDGKGMIQFQRGINKVPRSLADHWYLKNSGVTAVKDEKK